MRQLWGCKTCSDVSEPALQLRDVQFGWPGQGSFSLALAELTVAPGQSILLLGESGSGKSTLLSLICGTLTADRGVINVAGTDLATLPGSARDRWRAEQIGVVFQQFNLLPFGTVLDNILLPLRFAPTRRSRAGDAKEKARALCVRLGLPATVLNMRARELSVGQQQRVAVARALIGEPPLLVADEPTSALDAQTQLAFLDLLFEQVAAQQTALLMVSHDPRLGAHFDEVLQIEDIAQITRDTA